MSFYLSMMLPVLLAVHLFLGGAWLWLWWRRSSLAHVPATDVGDATDILAWVCRMGLHLVLCLDLGVLAAMGVMVTCDALGLSPGTLAALALWTGAMLAGMGVVTLLTYLVRL
jgi:hypothetical protein